MTRHARRRAGGFTLLEVLVAMAIFAIIGLGANELLRTITRTHDRAKAVTDSLGQLSMAFVIMQRDLTEIVPRSIRDGNGDVRPPLIVGTGNDLMAFTRTGWNNPTGLPRSDMQRIAYDLTDKGVLQRKMWMELDRAQDSKPVTQVLLSGVTDVRVNLLEADGTSVDTWPQSAKLDQLPAAIELVIDTKTLGELRRVFALVDNPDQPGQPGQGTGQQQNSPGPPGIPGNRSSIPGNLGQPTEHQL